MSSPGDPVWWDSIDREAAMREQFPSIEKLRRERTGCEADREQQVFWHAHNRVVAESRARSLRSQEVDADRFIAAARARKAERLRVWATAWKQQHANNETRTA